MTDIAAGSAGATGARPALVGRGERQRRQDAVFHGACLVFAVTVLILLGGIILSLIQGSLPAFSAFGAAFITDDSWSSSREQFGALAPIYGTVVTSIIAMAIGVPLAFGIAVFLTELCPQRLRRPIGTAIELLAGIPSIIYGIWGFFVFAPLVQSTLNPLMDATLGQIPFVGELFQRTAYGVGILTAGLILAVMILPFVTSVTRDVFETVPPMVKEAAYGLGATTWEVVRKIVIPYTRVGLVGGVMLGLGRALGETMAVAFVVGNTYRISTSLLAPGTTISASIANEFAEAEGLLRSSLFALGLILFVITFIVLALSRLMLARMARGSGT